MGIITQLTDLHHDNVKVDVGLMLLISSLMGLPHGIVKVGVCPMWTIIPLVELYHDIVKGESWPKLADFSHLWAFRTAS